MIWCGKQVFFGVFFPSLCHMLTARQSPPTDWRYHKQSNVTPSGSGEKQGRELACTGRCLCFFICPELGDGEPKPANSCLEIENS